MLHHFYIVMRGQLLLLVLLLPTIARAGPRIVGGRSADIKSYPYQLSLMRSKQHICGAAILCNTTAITSAHCLQTSGPYSIKAGITNLREPGVVIHVNMALVHPQYNHLYVDYDIALLFLASPLNFTDKIQPVSLPAPGDQNRIKEGMIGKVSGWGVTNPRSKEMYTEQLRALELPVWSMEQCKNAYFNRITERMFCAGLPKGGKDTCSGDSGGPFVVDNVLRGLVSGGIDCAQPMFPGIYTDVQVLRSFIDEYSKC